MLAVIPYDGVDQAIAIANDSDYGLGGSVWTSDPERADAVARRVQTGSIGINHYPLDPAAPFGGVKASGIGRELGPEGLAAYLQLQPRPPPRFLARGTAPPRSRPVSHCRTNSCPVGSGPAYGDLGGVRARGAHDCSTGSTICPGRPRFMSADSLEPCDAGRRAEEAGVADRVSFQVASATA